MFGDGKKNGGRADNGAHNSYAFPGNTSANMLKSVKYKLNMFKYAKYMLSMLTYAKCTLNMLKYATYTLNMLNIR